MSIEGQCHFLTLAQGRFHMKIKACIRNHLVIFNQILYVSFQVHGNENLLIHDAGHMTKMANMPIYGKILQKSSLWNRRTDFHVT